MGEGYRQYETSTNVTVTTDWTDILEILTDDGRSQAVHYELTNEGGSTALSDIRFVAEVHPEGDFFIYSTTPKKVMTANPKTLAAGATSRFSLDVGTVYSVKLQARVASGSTTVSCRAIATERPLGGMTLLDVSDALAVTDTSKSLATLGLTVQADLKKLLIYPAEAGIYWASGTANASTSAWLHTNGLPLDCQKFEADLLEFITASGTKQMVVIQLG